MYCKLTFFRVHYYLLSPYNNEYSQKYFNFYTKKIYFNSIKYYFYIQIVNIFVIIIVVFTIIMDLVINDLLLDYSLTALRWYGLFKFFHIIIKFIATKQNLVLDYYAYNWTYPGDYITGSFWQNWDFELDQEYEEKENKYRFEVIAK